MGNALWGTIQKKQTEEKEIEADKSLEFFRKFFFPSKRCLNMTQIFSKQPSVELNVTVFNGKQLHSLAHW